jgi:hypothetical protein
MNRCYLFRAIGSSGAPSTSLIHWDRLTQLIRRYTLMHCRFIRCRRTLRQNLIVCFFETVKWTAAPPSAHSVLKLQSWRISVLIQTKHQIDRWCPHLDHQIIRCYCLMQLFSFKSSDATTEWTVGSSDGANCIRPSAQCTKCTDACTEGTVGASDGVNFLSFLPRFPHFGMWYFCIHGT